MEQIVSFLTYGIISQKLKITCINRKDKGFSKIEEIVTPNVHVVLKISPSQITEKKTSYFPNLKIFGGKVAQYGLKLYAKFWESNDKFVFNNNTQFCIRALGKTTQPLKLVYLLNKRKYEQNVFKKLYLENYYTYNVHSFSYLTLPVRQSDTDQRLTQKATQIFVGNEKMFRATMSTSLLCLYENIPSTFNMSNTSLNRSLSSSMNGSFSSPSCLTASPESCGTQKNGTPSGPRVSALTERFGRRSISGSQDSPTAASPVTSSPIMFGGLKRSLSHAAGEPHSKQPKLENFIKTSGSDNESNIMSENTTPQTLDESKNNYDCTKLENRTDNDADCESICDEKPLSFDNIGLSTHETNQQVGEQINDTFYSQKDFEDASEIFENDNIVLGRLNNFEQIQSSSNDNKSGLNSISKFNINPTLFAPSPSSNYKSAHNATDNFLNNLKAKRRSVPGATNENTSHNVTTKAHNATDKFLNSLKARRNSPEITIENTPISQYCPSRSICKTSDENLSTLETVKVEYMNTSEINDLEIEEFDGYEEIERNEEYMLTAPKMIICEEYDPQVLKATRKSKSVYFSISNIKEKLEKQKRRKDVELVRRFRAKIAPTDNSAAEEELRKEISKDMFVKIDYLTILSLSLLACCLSFSLSEYLFLKTEVLGADTSHSIELLQTSYDQKLLLPANSSFSCIHAALRLHSFYCFSNMTILGNLGLSLRDGWPINLLAHSPSSTRVYIQKDITNTINLHYEAVGMVTKTPGCPLAARNSRKVILGRGLYKDKKQGIVRRMPEINEYWQHVKDPVRHSSTLNRLSSMK
ncbi:unnamed protein product, partial [Meganyctiphanes norvegica]